MPDGVAEKLQKEFAKYKPHEPEGGPKQRRKTFWLPTSILFTD